MDKEPRRVTIFRLPSQDDGTLGVLTDGVFHARTLELPWKNNERNKSCIPVGEYDCEIVLSKTRGRVYYVKNVMHRTGILFHNGNVAGNVDMLYESDTEGCILIGEYTGFINGQRGILNSKKTLKAFINHMEGKPFRLDIQNIYK